MSKYRLKSGLHSQFEVIDGKRRRKTYRPGDIVEGDFSGNNKFEPLVEVEVASPSDETSEGTEAKGGKDGGKGKGKGKGGSKKAESESGPDEPPSDETSEGTGTETTEE